MQECRGCGSRDMAPVRGSAAFDFCRRCLLVQRRAAPAAAKPATGAFGAVERLAERHGLGRNSLVIGVGAVPLLDRLADEHIHVLAIEDDAAAAQAARRAGIPVVEAHFGPELAEGLAAAGRCADLVLVPGFGRLAEPGGAAQAIAALLKTDGAAELVFASAAEILPKGAFAAVAGEATLPSLRAAATLFEPHGLHLNDATRAGRHHLLRASLSTARQPTQRLQGLLAEEARIGAHAARFYAGTAAELLAPRRGSIEEGAGATP